MSVYEVSMDEYMERQERMLAARGVSTRTIKPDEILAILGEVPPVPVVPGRRYRVTVLGGEPTTRHVHGEDDYGRHIAADIPDVLDASFVTMEAAYLGRVGGARQPNGGALLLRLDDGRHAVIADMDVLRLEALASS